MKFRFAFILIISSGIISCSLEINKENLSGSWKADRFVSTIPGIPEEFAKAGEKEFLSSVYTLNTDNSLSVKSDYFSNGASGRWELDETTSEISLFYSYDTIKGIEKYKIVSLEKKELILRQDMENGNGYVEITLKK